MIRVLHHRDQRDFEDFLIQNKQLTPFELMESAAQQMAARVQRLLDRNPQKFSAIYVLVGPGSNGGDALSLVRHLLESTLPLDSALPPITLFCLPKGSELCERQKKLLQKLAGEKANASRVGSQKMRAAVEWLGYEGLTKIDFQKVTGARKILLIDGIFGIGISDKKSAFPKEFKGLKNIRASRNVFYVVSVDLPSALLESGTRLNEFEGLDADLTLTVAGPKFSQLQGEGVQASGTINVVPLLAQPPTVSSADKLSKILNALPIFLSSLKDFREVFAELKLQFAKFSKSSHKNSLGPSLVVGGMLQKGGAAKLSAEALLRSGAGSVFLNEIPATSSLGREIFYAAHEWISLNHAEALAPARLKGLQTIVFGPGLPAFRDPRRTECAREVAVFLAAARRDFRGTLVVDGGGLSFWAEDLAKHGRAAYSVVATPHPQEGLDLLTILGASDDGLIANRELFFSELRGVLRKAQVANDSVLLLKGAYPVCGEIVDKKTYVFDTADSRLSTQGSGDVLAGVIASFVNRLTPGAHRALGATLAALMCQKYLLKFSRDLPVIIARDQVKLYAKLGPRLIRALEVQP